MHVESFFWWIYIACDIAEIFCCCLYIVLYWFVHCRILLLLFLQLCCMCMWQNPSAALLHFYGVPCTIFLLLVLNCRYGKTGMACPLLYTFLTSKPVSGKKWETTDFYCDSIAATLTSLLPARREVQDKSWLRLTWEEKVKRKTFWVTHFFNGSYWLCQWYRSVSVNFNQMNYQFFSPSKLLNKNIFINWFLFVHMEVLICNSIFLQDRFHSDWIAFVWNILHWKLHIIRLSGGWETLALNQKEGWKKS